MIFSSQSVLTLSVLVRHCHVDSDWVPQPGPGQRLDGLSLSGTEEPRPTLFGEAGHDSVQLLLEPHLQETVCLIKHQNLMQNERH